MTEMWVGFDGNGTKDTGDQVTTYTYGVTKGTGDADSKIGSNRLLYKVVYPEQSSGQAEADRRVSYAYNAQGQQKYMKDQAGNIHQYDYDTAGRRTQDRATTIVTGDGFDDAVKRIATAYTSRGRVDTVTQYDNATVGSGSVLDQVQCTYDDWGPVSEFAQDHDSVVGTGDAYKVAYTYEKATGGRNTIRCTQQKQKLGSTDKQTVDYQYLSSSGGASLDDDNASRVTTVKVGGTVRGEYRYLGMGQLVETDLAQPVMFSRVHDGATPPVYQDLDRFNRITTNRWTKDLSTDRDFVSFDITWDRDSNPTRVIDNIHKTTATGNHSFDAKYTIDNLNRLTGAREGHWDGSDITTGNRNREELWTLNQVGDQTLDQLDLNGDGDQADTVNSIPEFNDARAYSDANELLTRNTDNSGGVEYTLGYDTCGNRTDDGKDYKYVYDAWGRMVRVTTRVASPPTVCEYRYNGLNFRIIPITIDFRA